MRSHRDIDERESAQEVELPLPDATLTGSLVVPPEASAVILFAHGSGSSRHSPRNQHVARHLRTAGLATLLIDLLTAAEERVDERTRGLRFDIPLLADRLCGAIDWLQDYPTTRDWPVGLFGASTGGGAALLAASRRLGRVGAVVSRGGRPDLAEAALPVVTCPTQLIVGGDDGIVIDLNRHALARLGSRTRELVLIPGAGHLFEEPGTLEEVARLTADWFRRHLVRTTPRPHGASRGAPLIRREPPVIRSARVRERIMFQDRFDGGRQLAKSLRRFADQKDVLVLALPRGGVPVGSEVARALHAPLDVFLVRKLGVPGHEELAMGAIGSGGVRVLNEEVVRELQISEEEIERATERESAELARRERLYWTERPRQAILGKRVLLVDDGLATGSTMRAAVRAVRRHEPASVVVAVPVGAPETCEELAAEADEVVCPLQPSRFGAVGQWYTNFDQTTDTEVQSLLPPASRWTGAAWSDGLR